jgi:hypothetical protein
MKRLLPFIVILPIILMACPMGDEGEWDGRIDGSQIYDLDVTQNKQFLTMTATLDSDALEALQLEFENMGEEYTEPDELFFWIAPYFANEWEVSPWNVKYAGEQLTMRPVARKRIEPGQENATVTIDLSKVARDWNRGWLSEWQFDGDEDYDAEMGNPGDDMTGCFLYMSDGYRHHWDSYTNARIDWMDPEGLATPRNFYFDSSYPAGTGVSNLRQYPDVMQGESWQTFTLLGEGLYVPWQVRGNEVFEVALQLPAGQDTMPESLWMRNQSTGADVELTEADSEAGLSEPSAGTFVWQVKIGADMFDPAPDGFSTYIGDAFKNDWFEINYQYMWASIEYLGTATILMKTDFDGGDFGMTGTIGPAAPDLVKYSENVEIWVDYPTYDWVIIPVDTIYNNWQIGAVPAGEEELLPSDTGFISGNNMLGLGNIDNGMTSNYDDLRNDFIDLPAFDYRSELDANPGAELAISFKARVEMDWDWRDNVQVQIEHVDENGDHSMWESIGWLDGPMEWWELQENNGWQEHTWIIWDWQIDPYAHPKKIRLLFQSDEWNTYQGLLLDDLEIYLIQ